MVGKTVRSIGKYLIIRSEMKRYLFLIFFLITNYLAVAQYYVLGDDPGGIHWKQIITANFQIIYPSSFEIKAQRMASILDRSYLFAGNTLHHHPAKISVILHTNTVRSNGFVAWAPARIELFTTPFQDIYAQDWLEQLAIHEFRHVVQIDKIDSELPAILRIILGEQAAALAIGFYLPFWFLEGDAVATETALSHTGRGRVPSFEMELKAQSIEKGLYSYDKAYLGSYRDYVPDYYQLGYQMVAGVRSKYGSESWSKVLSQVAHKPLSLNPFSFAIKQVTGTNLTTTYDTIFNSLKKSWVAKDNASDKTEFKIITKPEQGYASYQYTYPLNDSTYFAVKYSMDNLTRFVLISSKGEEKIIFTPGSLFEESITCGNGKVLWIESKPDVRWTHREFSLLRNLNLSNGAIYEHKYSEKIYAPCLSVDGKHLAAVKVDQNNRCSIVLLTPESGKIEKETTLAKDLFILTPSWSDDNTGLIAVVLGKEGKSLAKIDPYTGFVDLLMPSTYNELRRPVKRGNWVYFTGSIEGVDDVYALNLDSRKIYRITKSRFGVRDVQPTCDGKNLIYSNYTSDGYKMVKNQLVPFNYSAMDSVKSFNYILADKLNAQEKGVIDFSVNDTATYQSKTYSKLSHLFNFHSWAPVHIDLANDQITPGLSLMSQNKLSTAITQLGYDYSAISKTGKWVAEFDYTGFFPVFKLKGDYGREKSQYFEINTTRNLVSHVVSKDTQMVSFSYKILNINGIVNTPLNLSHGTWNRLLQPEFQIGYTQVWQDRLSPFSNGNYILLTSRLYAYNTMQLSLRDLQPAIGQIIDLNYHSSPTEKGNSYPIWTAEETLYFPGLVRHQGLRIYSGYQHKQSAGNSSTDYIFYPRGYLNLQNSRLFCLKSDYILPVFYPDWSLGRLTYLKRISLRIFYDQAWATVPVNNQINNSYRVAFGSAGAEWTADCNFLRLYVPVKIGARTSYLISQRKIISELLLSVNFGAL